MSQLFTLEPPPTNYDLNFRVAGIPVRVHPFFWIVTALLGASDPRPRAMFTWILAVFISILVHELGHALMIRRYGWRPWITLHGFGGLASYQPTHSTPWSQTLIALAGPAAGFLLAGVIIAALRLAKVGFPFFGYWISSGDHLLNEGLDQFVFDMLQINLFWGLVNLLPIIPMDGSRVTQEVLSRVRPHDGMQISLWLSIFCAGAMAVIGLARFNSLYIALMFGYLAYTSYQILNWSGRR
jgi:Zn-dependent protease